MDPTDKELREQLSQGPLVRNGFDERLRRRIEENLERPRRRFGRSTRFGWNFAGAAAVVLALTMFGVWQWSPLGGHSIGGADSHSAGPAGEQLKLTAEPVEDLTTGLLLGLRKDVTAPDGRLVSTYRTVLVAPEDNKLEKAAEGPGIVMPYTTTFWKIESTPDDGDTESQTLLAYQAYGSQALTERPASVVATPREGLLSERLLYVGKKYISVAEEVAGTAGQTDREYRYVKDIKQLAQSVGTPFSPSTEPHVNISEAVGSDETSLFATAASGTAQNGTTPSKPDAEQWAIVRKPGQWNGVTFANAAGTDGSIDATSAKEIGVKLPDEVAPHDELLLTWDQIRQIDPAATDAYTYNDLLATVSDREIKVYPYKQKDGLSHPLKLELDSGETVIMVQWALNQSEKKNYADQWRVKVAQIFGQQ